MTNVDVPQEWVEALLSLSAFRRIAVLGVTDVGKSSFVRALVESRPDFAVIDLDPGQKMVGPPGTVSLGRACGTDLELERIIFTGSTSSSSIFHLSRAASALATAEPFVANTSGFIRDLGARLQAVTISALRADCVLTIGDVEPLVPILAAHAHLPVISIAASPFARRKSPGSRRANRQAAFEAALTGAVEQMLWVPFEPARPLPSDGKHAVCALSAEEDMELGILLSAGDGCARVLARLPRHPVARIRLGRMWVAQAGEGWKLLEKLSPSWDEAAR